MSSLRNTPIGAVLFLVTIVILGLHVAECGVNEMLSAGRPRLVDLVREPSGDLTFTLVGISRSLTSQVAVLEFHASPDGLMIGPRDNPLFIPTKVVIPGSDSALEAIRALVLGAAEAGFGAAKVFCKWLENRDFAWLRWP